MNYRIVVDTNIIISAFLSPAGKPAHILDAIIDGRLFSITSHAILDEARRVFSYPKLLKNLKKNKVGDETVGLYLDRFAQVSLVVPGEIEIAAIEQDPDYNIILACAVEGGADYIVTGDQHLTVLRDFQGMEIKNPAEFWLILESASGV